MYIFIGRTVGMVTGILLSLVLTITVLPSSAHMKADTRLADAVRGLLRLHGLVWLPLKDTALLLPSPGKGALQEHGADELASDLLTYAVDSSHAIGPSEQVADKV